ncbi:hypothetical protein CLOM_g6314 [Closterium sp. NIES-68]|nr:hypothetical protein CLOM_g6314 [Closterium sp. NIES-68]
MASPTTDGKKESSHHHHHHASYNAIRGNLERALRGSIERMRGARGSIERNASAVSGNLERAIRIARGNRQLPSYLLSLVALLCLTVLIFHSSDWSPSAVFDNADSLTAVFPAKTDFSQPNGAKANAGGATMEAASNGPGASSQPSDGGSSNGSQSASAAPTPSTTGTASSSSSSSEGSTNASTNSAATSTGNGASASSASSSSSSGGGGSSSGSVSSNSSGALLTSDSPAVTQLLAGNLTAEKTLVWETPWLGITKEQYLISGTKYLYVPTAGDLCMGMGHFKWSLVCRLSEAAFLNRTLVLDAMVCLNGAHNAGGYGLVRPLYAYFDLHELKSHLPFTPLQGFRSSLAAWHAASPSNRLSTLIVPKIEPASALAEGERRDVPLIIRNLTTASDFGFAACDAPEGASLPRNWSLLPMQKEIQWVISNITLQMNNSNYDVVHVRRGDKALDSKRWPNLDKDTRADALLKRLPELIQPGRFLYVSTDERSPGFFDPLKDKFNVRLLQDFKELWSPGSGWYQVYSDMLGKTWYSIPTWRQWWTMK